MKVVPIVALVEEDLLPKLAAAGERLHGQMSPDLTASLDPIMAANGWTTEMLAAGAMVKLGLTELVEEGSL